MSFRPSELHDEDVYFLDCAQEQDNLDSASYLALRLYGDRDEVHGIIGESRQQRPEDAVCLYTWRDRFWRCDQLMGMADRILAEIAPAQAGPFIWVGLRQLPRQLKSYAEICAWMAYEDSTVGGCMEPFFYDRYCKIDNRGYPTKRVYRRLHAPKFIRNYVRREDSLPRYRAACSRMIRRWQMVHPDHIREGTAEIEEQFARQHEIENQRRMAELQEQIRRDIVHWDGPHIRIKPEFRHRRQMRNRILKRAARTAVTILGREHVSTLARGGEIEIVGEKIAFRVKCNGLARIGHGALDVKLVDHGGRHLANLCMFHPKTPAIDQVMALALDVVGGEEREILAAANPFLVTDVGYSHPLLADRVKPMLCPPDAPQPRERIVIDAGTGRRLINQARQHKLNQDYCRCTFPFWIDAVCSQVFPDRGYAKRMIDIIHGMASDSAASVRICRIDERVC